MKRIGFAVGTLVALGFPTPAVAQDAPPLQRPNPDSRFSILDSRFPDPSIENRESRIENQPESFGTFTGSLRLEYFARDSAIEDLRSRVTGIPTSGRDETFVSADARLRLDVRFPGLRLAAEAAVLPYEDGVNTPLGDVGGDLLLKQLFIDLENFPTPDLTLRAGAFEYAWRIRPHGEPFLLDLGRAESFFSGAGDRDVVLPAGALAKWRAADFVEVEALWMTSIEGGPASADESPVALLVNFPLSERSAVFLGALHVVGGADQRVTTWGGGADAYFGDDRTLELFGEAWLQSGNLSSGVSRRAWAAHAGARRMEGPWRTEFSAAFRSGDGDPLDGQDGTFQSYEGQERLRIVDSAEFGLDWDVNVLSARFSVAHRIGASAEARIDAGWFRMDESVAALDKHLGLEVDATITLEISRAASAWLTFASLSGSEALETATPDQESRTFLAAFGVKAQW